ncbi:GDSL esterase/lipase EXL3 [Arabidopsis thaliana]|uniref:GDSL esterase/lipase EXL3 n=4 Tax=Arabidopsis TaxID=3701 RepID=EXL3_ARATH|nr:GDSL-like Lipase/Acylhydrolase superfamily protein [Arabidopsis thaliana]Q94CH6.1 RecName: Full=GDSL esterase/lipase EXL3; AltName: Full=Family II extracellular lipase 3; Short=Family II lipase EXL3; Flags: Precursor [Arabidopsis thaliana]KAG7651842.1 GDSL lipase/esterase [Arabidopsis thaliana x Arabidopsis arenosa]KAG7659709.1 GDSL lipase/esterase [Arabidopsis suecica]AAK30018.1 family II lipase EXL3 [Arabidopsis thaliana]AEE35772.1 GDSL-like Lipase/Acylhydrolase superfamily protein [Arabi|eukprot:NP_177718.1 GDSL-like Lipase/Acylhydrolase superfamily protein [Arabidopsis thaliana]
MKDNSSWSCSCSWSSWKICLLSVLFLTETITAVKLPPKLIIPAVIAFGDSIVDTGMNNNVKTVVKCDFLPYGINFQSGVATGRFCDGRVPADLLAEELGIKSIVPAYLDPNLKSKDLLTGVSFASGGSGYDPITPKLVAVISLEDQLSYFEEYIEKVKNIVGEARKDFIVANSLFLLVAGSDDIANTYYTLRARPEYDVDSYTTLMSDSASEFVTKLYGYGVRRVAVFGAPPIGCVPSQRTLGGGILRDCADNYNEAAKLFNSKLSPKLDSLRKTLPGIKPIYINIYDPLFDIIQNPANYGFEVSNKGCCGTGAIEVAVLCNKITSSVCPDVSTHVFWDSYHPTEKTYKVLVSLLINKFVNQFV